MVASRSPFMRSWCRLWLLVVICACVAMFSVQASAQHTSFEAYRSALNIQCLTMPALEGAYSAKAIVCMREMLGNVSNTQAAGIARYMQGIAGAVIVLAFTLFGLRLTFGGVRHVAGEAVVLALKAGFVMLILASMASGAGGWNVSQIAVRIQDDLMGWADQIFNAHIGFLGTTFQQIMRECHINRDLAAFAASGATGIADSISLPFLSNPIDIRTWNALDCLAGLMIGGVHHVLPNVAIFSFLVALFFSGPFGIACFFAVVNLFFSFFTMLIRSIFILMYAYLTIAVILLFFPLVVPLLMFKRTFIYFNNWIGMYIGVIFQPFLLKIYSGFAVLCIMFFMIGASGTQQTNLNSRTIQLYSLWQVLMFDQLQRPADREELVSRIIKRRCKSIFFAEGSTPDTWVRNAGMAAEIVEKGVNKLFGENSVSFSSDALYVPCIFVGKDSDYEKWLQGYSVTGRNGSVRYPLSREVRDSSGNLVRVGIHRWYNGAIDDSNRFNLWFQRQLLMAILAIAIMVYLFNELNKAIPEMARSIAGVGGLVLTRGSSNLFTPRDGSTRTQSSAGVTGAAVPLEARIQAFLDSSEAKWAESYENVGYNPVSRAWAFVRGGVSGTAQGAWSQARETDVGEYIHRKFGD